MSPAIFRGVQMMPAYTPFARLRSTHDLADGLHAVARELSRCVESICRSRQKRERSCARSSVRAALCDERIVSLAGQNDRTRQLVRKRFLRTPHVLTRLMTYTHTTHKNLLHSLRMRIRKRADYAQLSWWSQRHPLSQIPGSARLGPVAPTSGRSTDLAAVTTPVRRCDPVCKPLNSLDIARRCIRRVQHAVPDRPPFRYEKTRHVNAKHALLDTRPYDGGFEICEERDRSHFRRRVMRRGHATGRNVHTSVLAFLAPSKQSRDGRANPVSENYG